MSRVKTKERSSHRVGKAGIPTRNSRDFLKSQQMKLISASVILILQVLGGVHSSFASKQQQCEKTCKEIRPTILGDPNRCAPALTINPSPKVYKACQDGSKKAFDMTCIQMCATTEAAIGFERKSSKACKTNRSRGPSEHWCKRGFASVVKKLYTYDFPENEPEIIDSEPLQENVVVENKDEASSVVEDDVVVDGPETKAKVEVTEAEAEPIVEVKEDKKVEAVEAKDKTIEAEPKLEPITEMVDLEVSIETETELEPEETEAEHVLEKPDPEEKEEEESPTDDNTDDGYSEF